MTETHVPNRGRIAVLTGAVPTALALAAMGYVYSVANRVPDPMAVHWGPSGGPDRWTSVSGGIGLAWLLAGVIILFAGALTAFSLKCGQMAMTRRLSAATSCFLASLLSAVNVGTFAVQVGVADGRQAGSVTSWIGIGLGAGAILAVAAWLLTLPDAPAPVARGTSGARAGMDLGAHERAVWTSRVTNYAPAIALGVVFVAVEIVMWVTLTDIIGIVVVTVLLGTVLAVGSLFTAMTITIDNHGLTAKGGLGVKVQTIPLDEVLSAEAVDVDPFREFGGWGVRTDVHGRIGIVLRSGPGLEVTRTNGRKLVITTPDAAAGAALLTTLAARAQGR